MLWIDGENTAVDVGKWGWVVKGRLNNADLLGLDLSVLEARRPKETSLRD